MNLRGEKHFFQKGSKQKALIDHLRTRKKTTTQKTTTGLLLYVTDLNTCSAHLGRHSEDNTYIVWRKASVKLPLSQDASLAGGAGVANLQEGQKLQLS